MEIIAHRGASFDAPENTLAAIRLGWQQQADAVELDVHLSHDGQLVVIHDSTTHKTAGVDIAVASQTLDELRSLDVGSWKDPSWLGEKIPTLVEALATLPPQKRLFIEIKCEADVAPELVRVLQQSKCSPAQIILIGFSLPAIQLLKSRFPDVEVGWIVELERHWATRRLPKPEPLIARLQAAGLNALDLEASASIDSAFVEKFHRAGLKLYVWTVDSAPLAKQLATAGIDGLTTNRPAWLREQMAVK
ncbi:MAG: ugpQ [Pedosphaera sp.]|nr:ugpQ [Pedosphaera sp.]